MEQGSVVHKNLHWNRGRSLLLLGVRWTHALIAQVVKYSRRAGGGCRGIGGSNQRVYQVDLMCGEFCRVVGWCRCSKVAGEAVVQLARCWGGGVEGG